MPRGDDGNTLRGVWVLVVGRESTVERPEGGFAALRDLGCAVHAADLWEPLGGDAPEDPPPSAVLIEALEEVDAGRAALHRLRAVPTLTEVPIVVAVTVNALSRVDASDGFDDLVLVPYVPAELYLRIRRAEWRRSEFGHAERIKIGELLIDLAAHEASVGGRALELTAQEFALLRFLALNRGRVFSRDQLLQRVWGVDHYSGSRTVDIHIRRLRMKLGRAAGPLETVRGVGYKMRKP